MAFSPQVNYTDWSTATGLRILVPTFVDRGVLHGQRSGTPMVVNLSFIDGADTLLSSSPSFMLTRQSGPHSRSTATQKIW
jgi:hypothetical protein